jgi:hypothetical protein
LLSGESAEERKGEGDLASVSKRLKEEQAVSKSPRGARGDGTAPSNGGQALHPACVE